MSNVKTAPKSATTPKSVVAATHVSRKIPLKQNPKRLNTNQYAGVKAGAKGIQSTYTASKGPEFNNYTPRKAESNAWAYVSKLLKAKAVTVAELKANVPATDKKAISGCLRHATRMGAIKLAA